MKKFLIRFNNGLVPTTMLMVGENEKEVVEAFKEDCNDPEFRRSNCFPTCTYMTVSC